MTTHPHPAQPRDRAHRVEALGRVPREVFDLLAASPTPLKAYELLWRLQEGRGKRAPPSTIYRAVAVLIEQGLVHKIESSNAFVVCAAPEHAHDPIFLVCERCGTAAELDGGETLEKVRARVSGAGFQARHVNFVIRGVCSACAR